MANKVMNYLSSNCKIELSAEGSQVVLQLTWQVDIMACKRYF